MVIYFKTFIKLRTSMQMHMKWLHMATKLVKVSEDILTRSVMIQTLVAASSTDSQQGVRGEGGGMGPGAVYGGFH